MTPDTALQFHDQGFLHLKGAITTEALDLIERSLVALYTMQAAKCGVEAVAFPDILETMEGQDKEALYQVQKLIPSTMMVRLPLTAIAATAGEILGCKGEPILIEGPGLFISRPNTQRLLYKWHSEAHYYPKRRRFVNVWLPMFGARTALNGAMSFKVGSHKRDFPFSEYQGYNKDTQGKANHFVQYEIPDNFLGDYPEHVCEAERGDVIFFHRQMVHRSNPNRSNEYSFALVARVWTPADDLTLSGTMAATPYGGDIGRPGLVVRPD